MLNLHHNLPLPHCLDIDQCIVDPDFDDDLCVQEIAEDHPAWFSNEIQSIGELSSRPYHFKRSDIPHFWDRREEEQACAERKKQIEFERAEDYRAWHADADIPTDAEGQRSPRQVQLEPRQVQPEPERIMPEPRGWWSDGVNGSAYRRAQMRGEV